MSRGFFKLTNAARDQHIKQKLADPRIFTDKCVCEHCGVEKEYARFCRIVGKKRFDPFEERYSKICESCIRLQQMEYIIHEIIDRKENLTSQQRASLKARVSHLLLIEKKDLQRIKKELGLEDEAIILESRMKVNNPSEGPKIIEKKQIKKEIKI